MLTLARNILKFIRHHTYREFFDRLWRAAVRPIYESAACYVVKLDLRSAAEARTDLGIEEIFRSDIDKMLEVMYVSRAGLHERFDRGDRCFAALDQGKIVSFFWVRFDCQRELHLTFKLPADKAWAFNAVTVKAGRGRSLYPNVTLYMARALLQSGMDELFVDVDPRNTPSIRGLEKAGCTRIALIRMRKVLYNIRYEITVFDKDAWQELRQMIEDFDRLEKVVTERSCQ